MLVALAATFAAAIPASADGGDTDPPVGDDGSNLVGEVADQINQINSGSPGGGASKPPSCTWYELKPGETPNPTIPGGKPDDPAYEKRTDGELQWVEPLRGHTFWENHEIFEGAEGMIFRYQCWHNDMAKDCPFMSDDGQRCMGYDHVDNFCGSTVCEFPAVNPRNIALLAVDRFVEALPPPQPQFNPPNGTTYVNFPTWMWVDGVPGGGHIEADPIAVPGMTVTTVADLDKVSWTMGDGGKKDCPLTVSEATAEAECMYEYNRSSANQPNNVYTGQASTVWEATWTIQESGQTGTVDAPRSTDFNLAVAEVQTVVQ